MVKTLTIKESTYERLLALKGKEESFSDLLDRLATRRDLETLRRIRGRLTTEEKREMLEEIAAKRRERRFA